MSLSVSPMSVLSPALNLSPPQAQVTWHQTLVQLFHLSVPAMPNLSQHASNPSWSGFCTAFPWCYLWDGGLTNDRPASLPAPSLLLLGGICVSVCVGVCLPSEEGGKKKSLRDAGRSRGALATYLPPDWLALSIPQSYGFFFSFLTEKIVFFEPRCLADFEKQRVFSLCESTPRIFFCRCW